MFENKNVVLREMTIHFDFLLTIWGFMATFFLLQVYDKTF
jgi:hypothetical protein